MIPKDLIIIYPQGIHTSERYKCTLTANSSVNHASYVDLNLKKDKSGWHKDKPVERVDVKYDPNNNIPTHEDILTNQIEKEVKALASDFCVTNEANQNLTPS